MESAYETIYRWQWFQRAHWLPTFRAQKRNSPLAFKKLLDHTGGRRALDCSCGLGLKTIVIRELGIDVVGCDGCAYAVEKARELAAAEGAAIEFFVARWEELPQRTPLRFDAVFNDALSWIPTREEFEASLAGIRGVLDPDGVLMFMGADEHSPSDPQSRRELFEGFWRQRPKFALEWSHADAGARCTCIRVREKGEMFIDSHHIFLIEEDGARRIETATVREPAWWHWDVLKEMFDEAGFSKLETRAFDGAARDGGALRLNVATK